MAYTKTNWINDSEPAINATNLNKIEQGIYDNAETLDSMHFTSGETYTKTLGYYTPCPGLITSGSTCVEFSYRTEKSLDNITSVTVNSMTGIMRGIGGYLDSASSETNFKSRYTVTPYIADSHTIVFELEKSSAMTSATNNTPVTVSLKSIGLTFR